MSIKEKTIKGFLGLGTYKVIGQGFTWVIFIIIARILRPEDFGLMALSTFFINFFNFISEFGLSTALIQKKDLSDDEINSSFWVMTLFNILMYVFIFILSHFIGAFYNEKKLIIIIQILGLNFIISSFKMIPLCLLTRQLEFAKFAKTEFYSNVIGSVSILLFAFSGFGVWSLVIGAIFQSTISAVLMFYYCPWLPRMFSQLTRIKKMMSFGMSVNTSKILSYLSDNADNLIVGKVLGGDALGLYNMAFILGTMPIKKTSLIIYQITFPVFSQLQNDEAMLRKYFLKINKYIFLFAFPSITGLLMLSDSFVKIVLGEKWIPIILPLKILCGVGILKSMSITLSPLLYSKGKANIMLKYSFLCGLILPLAFYVGAKFSVNGVAISWIVVYPFVFFYLLILALREINLTFYEYMANMLHPLMGTFFMVAMVVIFQYSVSINGYFLIIGSCLTGLLSFSVFVLFVSREIFNEFKNILYILQKKRSRA